MILSIERNWNYGGYELRPSAECLGSGCYNVRDIIGAQFVYVSYKVTAREVD